ncbi:hypothetical protein NPIL_119161 [Nephila pilipes]|uniref:Uncharacterized protein n=1 Tax=Nephila pilipes TaxID=299642 RepID=A0A8X6U4K5_NEPPI|nr:hypothetical protein NPIL_119161 [Nephila pilipes]
MWPLDVHYRILLGSSVHQLFFDPMYYHSAQLLPQQYHLPRSRCLGRLATTPWGCETEPVPEGTGAEHRLRQASTCMPRVRRHSPTGTHVAYAIGDIKIAGNFCLIALSYRNQKQGTIRNHPVNNKSSKNQHTFQLRQRHIQAANMLPPFHNGFGTRGAVTGTWLNNQSSHTTRRALS